MDGFVNGKIRLEIKVGKGRFKNIRGLFFFSLKHTLNNRKVVAYSYKITKTHELLNI